MTGLALEEFVELGELALECGVKVGVHAGGRFSVVVVGGRGPEQFRDVGHLAQDLSDYTERDELMTHEEGVDQSGENQGGHEA